ncbi:MAG: DUF4399 domain-containing protein [Gammaproteobacteria bacterium]
MKFLSLTIALTLMVSGIVYAGDSPSPASAQVYFVNLEDKQEVKSPFRVIFGLRGMGVAPAGVDNKAFKYIGHHHLFVNSVLTDEIRNGSIPFDQQHLHFGQGQTETELDLPPGKYTLLLVFGDPYHAVHTPVVASEKITIEVK